MGRFKHFDMYEMQRISWYDDFSYFIKGGEIIGLKSEYSKSEAKKIAKLRQTLRDWE